ncbi:Piso0_000884 [Millerozyma farinosa CBS 7064]|uniref:Piso0_000884 protein n=1 Tax=Pichia sorbitophila (strain ATCC MYA-4447 / BCRC 22081 / CBS 7064 / NBRC 10061 / NRRL Y-12695) TaxID=559304 RepID=G8YQB7_PICSO|nr:Piso0_000884 [Millerozyma farinosa CBS 7064]
MSIIALCILHWPENELAYQSSELLIGRDYQFCPKNSIDLIYEFEAAFKTLSPDERTPFIYSKGISYIYIWGDNDIIFLAITNRNVQVMQTIIFLKHFYLILMEFLIDQEAFVTKGEENAKSNDHSRKSNIMIDKDSIKDNSCLIYELFDECIDFGIIQTTDYKILREFIKLHLNKPEATKSYEDENDYSDSSEEFSKVEKSSKKKSRKQKFSHDDIRSTKNKANTKDVTSSEIIEMNSSIVRTGISSINWRPKGIFYPKNEIYLDIVELIDFEFDLERNIIKKNEIRGFCFTSCYLSGMPVCRIGLNEEKLSITSSSHEPYNESVSPEIESDEKEYDAKDDTSSYDQSEQRDDGFVSAPNVADSKKSSEDNNKHVNIEGDTETSHYNTKVVSSVGQSTAKIANIHYHQCIDLTTLNTEGRVCFIPPDDKFMLMSYQADLFKQKKKPLIMIIPSYRIHKDSAKLQVLCVLSTSFTKRLRCKNLVIRLPVNPYLIPIRYNSIHKDGEMRFKAEIGSVTFKIDTSELIWSIEEVHGKETSLKMMAEIALDKEKCLGVTDQDVNDAVHNKIPSSQGGDTPISNAKNSAEVQSSEMELDSFYGVSDAPISSATQIKSQYKNPSHYNIARATFLLPSLSYSGLKVTYIDVSEPQLNYSCFPWIKYSTESKPHSSTDNSRLSDDNSFSDYLFKLGVSSYTLVS